MSGFEIRDWYISRNMNPAFLNNGHSIPFNSLGDDE